MPNDSPCVGTTTSDKRQDSKNQKDKKNSDCRFNHQWKEMRTGMNGMSWRSLRLGVFLNSESLLGLCQRVARIENDNVDAAVLATALRGVVRRDRTKLPVARGGQPLRRVSEIPHEVRDHGR